MLPSFSFECFTSRNPYLSFKNLGSLGESVSGVWSLGSTVRGCTRAGFQACRTRSNESKRLHLQGPEQCGTMIVKLLGRFFFQLGVGLR